MTLAKGKWERVPSVEKMTLPEWPVSKPKGLCLMIDGEGSLLGTMPRQVILYGVKKKSRLSKEGFSTDYALVTA